MIVSIKVFIMDLLVMIRICLNTVEKGFGEVKPLDEGWVPKSFLD